MDSASAYIYAGSGTPAEQVSLAAGTVSYLDTDSLGSVRGIVSAAGALTATTSYDAWGNPQTADGLTAYTPFGYAGGYTDPDGLIYLINRYYDPATGQFTSVDPDVTQTLDPYGYADGNPVTNTDPSGLLFLLGGGGSSAHYSAATVVAADAYTASFPTPWPLPPPPPAPRPRPHHHHSPAPQHSSCGGFWGFACHTLHCVGHQIHKHAEGLIKAGLAVGAIGLTVLNAAQGGADPFTDGAEVADVEDLVSEAADAAEDLANTADDEAGSCIGDPVLGGESFAGGTKVLLASGAAKPISQLKTGDKVLATNTKTGKTQAETVTAVLVHHDTDLYDLTIKVRGRTAVIQTTSHHRFWDQTTGRWTYADALAAGDLLRTPGHTQVSVINGHAPADTVGWMWDLTIANDHDFYIDVANTAVLVHNCPTAGEGSPRVSDVLKTKLGSIMRAPLPSGSPSWSDIGDMTMDEVRAAARANQPGFKTILKLLTDSRFSR
jgi:RHS repeat-associated protein